MLVAGPVTVVLPSAVGLYGIPGIAGRYWLRTVDSHKTDSTGIVHCLETFEVQTFVVVVVVARDVAGLPVGTAVQMKHLWDSLTVAEQFAVVSEGTLVVAVDKVAAVVVVVAEDAAVAAEASSAAVASSIAAAAAQAVVAVDTVVGGTALLSAGMDKADPAALRGTFLTQHPSDQGCWKHLQHFAALYCHELPEEVDNVLAHLHVVAVHFFCFVWDWPYGSSHEHFGPPGFLSAPAHTVCGFVEGLQCDSSEPKPGE